jgi:3-hydroxyacyl-[acyl-carrier-protein] dehydratase
VSSRDPIECGLPHREPFVFVDEVLELEPGLRAVCRKVFRREEPFFAGHFPGNPLVPGVLLTEAMAQTAGIAAGGEGRLLYLSAIRTMKFLRPVPPGETVIFRAEKCAEMGMLIQSNVSATIDDNTVAEGVVILSERRT